MMDTAPVAQLSPIDYAVMGLYFVAVLGVGWGLRRLTRTSTDFFLSGRSLPPWITGLAFISANLGAQEVIGMGASGAKYGIAISHFYWVGAIPAMVFVGLFMMPFYYGSRARSVPEYLRLRFDEKTRTLNAASFAVMTVFSSGVSMYAMGKLLNLLLGWSFDASVLVAALIVLAYILLGGLTSAIYNEVLQFFLIVFGFIPLVALGLYAVGGWGGLSARLEEVASGRGLPPEAYTHTWSTLGDASQNPIGVEWFGLVMGLGFVLSFGYWCTDFLVVQRAMIAKNMNAARRTPIVAAVPKMLMPLIVVLPGVVAIALMQPALQSHGYAIPSDANGQLDYTMTLPSLIAHYYPSGLLGVGITALIASFMSGMAGNVTAFNAVFTYDIYQAYFVKNKTDRHYLVVGKFITIAGILISIVTAYIAKGFNNINDFLQLVFGFVNGPLFATFLLGMFWKRTTGHGAFWGLVAGTCAAAVTHGLTIAEGKGGWIAPIYEIKSGMGQAFIVAGISWIVNFFTTIIVSLMTKPKKEEELAGLVYSLTEKPKFTAGKWYQRIGLLAILLLAATILLNIIFF